MEERRRWLQILVPVLLVGTATVVLLGGLGHPDRIIFDETYYVNDARDFLEQGVEDGFVVHPPVGKLLIAASIRVFGDSPFGWRALGAILGIVSVWLTYDMGRRLFRRIAPAALAGLLLLVDGVFLVQARTAMLDIHLTFFVVLGAWALVRDAQRTREADEALLAADPGPFDRLPRRDRSMLVLAGVAFGLAAATKWSGVLALGAGGLTAIAIEVNRRRRVLGHWWRRPWRAIGLLALTLLILPASTYLVTWGPWLANFGDTYQGQKDCGDDQGDGCALPITTRLGSLWRFNFSTDPDDSSMLKFHNNLEAEHSYRAPAYTWPVLARPVVYYYETCGENRQNRVPTTDDDGNVEIPEPCRVEPGQAGEVLAVGNPAVWWPFLAAGLVLAAGAIRGDPRSALPLVFVLGQFVPWLIVDRPVFSFYSVPMVPFVALGIAAVTSRLLDRDAVVPGLLGGLAGVGTGLLEVGAWDLLTDSAASRGTYGIIAGIMGVFGATVTGWLWARAASPRGVYPRADGVSPTGRWVIGILAVAAVGVALYLFPVWFGIALDEDAIRSRWWFRGWI